MEWQDEFSVGIALQDKDHRDLVQCVTDIADAATTDALRAAMEGYIFCIRAHFAAEERLMQMFNYPHFAAHITEHEELLSAVRAIDSGLREAPASAETTELRQKSLQKHFMADEKDYGVFVLSRSTRREKG